MENGIYLCAECGAELEVLINEHGVFVQPCETCLDTVYDNGFEDGAQEIRGMLAEKPALHEEHQPCEK